MKTESQKHENGLPSEVKPLKWRKFRLTFLFAFTAIKWTPLLRQHEG